jgi:DNA invertase Pin-like site-specific DNA recombinase
MTAAWSATTTPDEVARRAGGRKHYNTWRKWLAFRRRYVEVARRLFAQGAWTRGVQARLARELGVSRATISRDVQYLKRQGHYSCPACGAMVQPPKPQQKCAN